MSEKFGPKQAEQWLELVALAQEEAMMLFKCSAWVFESFLIMQETINGKIVSIKTKERSPIKIGKFPDSKMRNFQEIGKSLDVLIRKINTDLPHYDSD